MQRTLLLFLLCTFAQITNALPNGFVYLQDRAPSIIEDMRYASNNNFIGRPIPGYKTGRCILTVAAAEHLAKTQKAARKKGYTLKVYDCYRPQTAVNAFYQWSQTPKDTRMKAAFYPREEKKYLFDRGYIAKASGHSRGSTIDLTLVKIGAKQPPSRASITRCYGKTTSYLNDNSIDTGTRFDCLDVSANIAYANLRKEQKNNRLLLRNLMISNGFTPYDKEWWHFTLNNEPYPNTYFDFLVR